MKVRIEVQVVNTNGKYSARIKSNQKSCQENIRNAGSLSDISDRILELLEEAEEDGVFEK